MKNAFGDNPHYLNGHRVLQELVLLRLLNSSGDDRQNPVRTICASLALFLCCMHQSAEI